MKRLVVLVAVLVPLSLFIAGCGGTGGSSGKSSDKVQATTKSAMESIKMSKGPAAPGGAKTTDEAAKK